MALNVSVISFAVNSGNPISDSRVALLIACCAPLAVHSSPVNDGAPLYFNPRHLPPQQKLTPWDQIVLGLSNLRVGSLRGCAQGTMDGIPPPLSSSGSQRKVENCYKCWAMDHSSFQLPDTTVDKAITSRSVCPGFGPRVPAFL